MEHKRQWLAVALVLIAGVASAQLPFTQNFEGNWPPTGWAVNCDNPPDTCVWHRARDLGETLWSANTTHFAVFENSPAVDLTDTLISPVINCSGQGSIMLRCSTYIINGMMPNKARIIGSDDGGATYTHDVRIYEGLGGSFGPGLETLRLDWAGDQSQVRLAWLYEGNTSYLGAWWAVDNVTITGGPIVHDVGTDSILAPGALVDSGSVVNPTAVIHNFGTVAETGFAMRFSIGADYVQTVQVTDFPSGAESTIVFPVWQAIHTGPFPVTCTTELAHDRNPGNDAVHGATKVVMRDVGVDTINVPSDTVDSGQAQYPQVRVKNHGPDPATFPVIMTIGVYFAAETVTIQGQQVQNVQFRTPWIPQRPTHYEAKCWTALAHDVDRSNDTARKTVWVRVVNVGVDPSSGHAPAGTIAKGDSVLPFEWFVNKGSNAITQFTAYFRIYRPYPFQETVYHSERTVTLEPGVISPETFDLWDAPNDTATFRAFAFTALPNDVDPSNDRDSWIFKVGLEFADVGVSGITWPAANTEHGSQARPQCTVINHSTQPASFWTHCRIDSVGQAIYNDSVFVDLPGSASQTAIMPSYWTCGPLGDTYTVKCSTALADDNDPTNDAASLLVRSVHVPPLGWQILTPILPAGTKKVKDGAGLAVVTGVGDADYVYGTVGNGTYAFEQYDIAGNTWSPKESIPAIGRSTKKKGVKKGGALTAVDGKVFAVKGNSVSDFFMYAPGSWTSLPSVPGTKTLKEGSSMAGVKIGDSSFVFLLKGSGTFDFYRYSVTDTTWITRKSAPADAHAKGYRSGSAITYDPDDNVIYAIFGSYKPTIFSRYDIATDSWTALETLPQKNHRGTKKVPKGGNALAYVSGAGVGKHVYAMKANNVYDLWGYDIAANAWTEMESMPSSPSGKKPNGGCALVGISTSSRVGCFALKGNTTTDFYFYPPFGTAVQERSVAAGAFAPSRLWVWPNPSGSRFSILLPAGAKSGSEVRVYAISGELVRTLAGPESGRTPRTLVWDGADRFGRRLPAGAYVIRCSTVSGSAAKVILER